MQERIKLKCPICKRQVVVECDSTVNGGNIYNKCENCKSWLTYNSDTKTLKIDSVGAKGYKIQNK